MHMWLRTLLQALRSQRGRPISLFEVSRTRYRVTLTDIDVLGHMNNGMYLSVADMGRWDLMRRSGVWRVFRSRGWYPVVAAASVTFRKSLKFGRSYWVQTKVTGFDEKAVFLEQRFVRDGEIHARALIRARFLRQGGGVVPMSDLLAAIGPIPAGVDAPAEARAWAESTALPSTRSPAPSDWQGR